MDEPLGIRHNLWLFLSALKEKQMRKELPTVLHLWVDALCINQRDLSERNAQLSMMGSIYRNATSVFAWLGWPHGWDPEMAFAFITKEYFRLFENSTDIGAWWERRKFNEQIQMVLTMCRCRYWSRRWILQEILLAWEIWLHCGENELSWLWFTRFLRQLELFRELASQQQIDMGAMVADFRSTIPFTISRYKDDKANNEQQSIFKLLHEFRATGCEVVHDKVYSLLGLSTSGSSISVDYSCSPRDLVYKLMLLKDSELNEGMHLLVKELGISLLLPKLVLSLLP